MDYIKQCSKITNKQDKIQVDITKDLAKALGDNYVLHGDVYVSYAPYVKYVYCLKGGKRDYNFVYHCDKPHQEFNIGDRVNFPFNCSEWSGTICGIRKISISPDTESFNYEDNCSFIQVVDYEDTGEILNYGYTGDCYDLHYGVTKSQQ